MMLKWGCQVSLGLKTVLTKSVCYKVEVSSLKDVRWKSACQAGRILMKDAIRLHYGKCRIQVFGGNTHTKLAIRMSKPLKLWFWPASQLYGRAILNSWSSPYRHILNVFQQQSVICNRTNVWIKTVIATWAEAENRILYRSTCSPLAKCLSFSEML